MKPEHLKLAGIVTMVCGGMSSLGAGATGSDSSTVASGRIIPMQSAPQDTAMGMMDAAAQETAPVVQDAAQDAAPDLTPDVAQTPDAAPVAQAVALDAEYAARTTIISANEVAVEVDAAVESASALDVPTVPTVPAVAAEAGVPMAASAESEGAQTTTATLSVAGDAAPVTVSLASNIAHVAHVAHVADVADVADVVHVADVADVVHVAATPATGEAQRDQAALKLGGVVDLVIPPDRHMQPADTDAHAIGAAVEHRPVAQHAAHADDADPAWASADLVAVNDNRLDDLRGGFDLPSGLVVSFGISREAFVNGNLVASTSFNIPNIAQMTPQQAQMLANANTGALIQTGLNNTVQPGALPGLTGAVIQNTLSNQQIQALTTINTTVNSLGAFKALNLGQTLNSALLSAVRPR
ncbi:hypothetical protein GCM10011400_17510 [Paraburkholderia caffeinilytica]|uniref:Lipoprotein n=2 Tax=Paraburkholderia caffeinilytica TaxID=1761016 RepID=A0ABQ1LZN4_9BURK|nr:hypothetical protein GCM10011400_17510 [Paraburkholderia caffeinilytica]CAB3796163.1 hypothetical protein LMG28690_04233 [Paraburkholderia caffeinilytica]